MVWKHGPGLRRIAKQWSQTHDEKKDIEIPEGLAKEEIYDAEWKKHWEMGWSFFMEKDWEWIMEDAKINKKAGKISEEQFKWYEMTAEVLKDLKDNFIGQAQIDQKDLVLEDPREKKAEKDEKIEESQKDEKMEESETKKARIGEKEEEKDGDKDVAMD